MTSVQAGLIDEVIVTYAPCALGAGAPVLPLRSEWTLAESAVNGEFLRPVAKGVTPKRGRARGWGCVPASERQLDDTAGTSHRCRSEAGNYHLSSASGGCDGCAS